nr:MAG TPA: hypothetical protein [Caudoviricetes sp.]
MKNQNVNLVKKKEGISNLFPSFFMQKRSNNNSLLRSFQQNKIPFEILFTNINYLCLSAK